MRPKPLIKFLVPMADNPLMRTRYKHGFSLIELLVAIAVVSIIVGLGAPGFSQLMQDSRLSTKYNTVSRALLMARSEAVKRSGRVVVCPRNNAGTACADDWSEGWLVFIDAAPYSTGATASVGAEDNLLALYTKAQDNIEISAYGSLSGQPAAMLNWIGYGTDGSAQVDTGSILLCDNRKESSALVLNLMITGDIRQGRKSPSDDVALDAYSQSVSCA